MANFITSCRIIFSIILLFVSPFKTPFYVFYLLAGFSDMIDGTIARKTNTVSELGSKLDTIADFTFIIVCLIKIIPSIDIPIWIWILIIIIAIIKTINILYGFIIKKEIVAEHTILNKITGFLLFIFPLTIKIININYTLSICAIVATMAAIHEGYIIIINKKDK